MNVIDSKSWSGMRAENRAHFSSFRSELRFECKRKRPGRHVPASSFFSGWDAYMASIAPMEKNSVSPEESSTPSLSVTT
ncbi:hypothetical protein GOA63_26905 [Sinorhizobium meliloti]|nr:hypothetical protein [Sinorhizobium meliloti]MDX0189492.1 hypothetical protein [Sinorhizobium meliloti]MQV10786.1 hypothetical protein [Sinorhizobium meliloti]MQV62563.1 hypothetical protein [Sinorhizobium meliloti]